MGRWAADERVYMIDTVVAEIMEILAQKHPDIVAGREMISPEVAYGKKGAESPFGELEMLLSVFRELLPITAGF